jgi:hypothetical protein
MISRYVLFSHLTGSAIYWLLWVRQLGGFKAGEDLHCALAVLSRVQVAERRCHDATGHYLSAGALGNGECGGLRDSIAGGTEDGFRVVAHVTVDGYPVTVHPAYKD